MFSAISTDLDGDDDHDRLCPPRLDLIAFCAAVGCGGPSSAPTTDAGAPPSDASSDGFDPSRTYPGEGEPCEFSLFCSEFQICVDGQCARHERVEPDDLVLGDAVRIPHETLRTSTLYTEATVDWDGRTGLDLYGQMFPGVANPTLAFFEDRVPCQVAIYGDGPVRVVHVPDLRCATLGMSPEGYVLLGGMSTEPTDRYGKWAPVAPDGRVIAKGGLPRVVKTRAEADVGNPDIGLYSITSILWHEDRFLFSAAASTTPPGYGKPDDAPTLGDVSATRRWWAQELAGFDPYAPGAPRYEDPIPAQVITQETGIEGCDECHVFERMDGDVCEENPLMACLGGVCTEFASCFRTGRSAVWRQTMRSASKACANHESAAMGTGSRRRARRNGRAKAATTATRSMGMRAPRYASRRCWSFRRRRW